MKRLIIWSVFLIIIIGCSLQKEMVTVKYKPTKMSKKYYLEIPRGFTFEGYGAVGLENRYVYADSSFIYVTNFRNTPNYYNIRKLGDSIAQYRFQDEELTTEINQLSGKTVREFLPDTLEISGIQINGQYWKDIKIGCINVGYINVTKEKKDIFDNAIKSIRERRMKHNKE